MLTDKLAVLHCLLAALATAMPLCCYKLRRLALCAFIEWRLWIRTFKFWVLQCQSADIVHRTSYCLLQKSDSGRIYNDGGGEITQMEHGTTELLIGVVELGTIINQPNTSSLLNTCEPDSICRRHNLGISITIASPYDLLHCRRMLGEPSVSRDRLVKSGLLRCHVTVETCRSVCDPRDGRRWLVSMRDSDELWAHSCHGNGLISDRSKC